VPQSELHKESEEVVVRRTLRRLDRYFRELEKRASQKAEMFGPESDATLTRINPLGTAGDPTKPTEIPPPAEAIAIPQIEQAELEPTQFKPTQDRLSPPPVPVAPPPVPVAPPPAPVAPPPAPVAPPPAPVAPVVKIATPTSLAPTQNVQKIINSKPSPKVTVQLKATLKAEPAAQLKPKQLAPVIQESGEFSEKNDTDSRVDLLFSEKKKSPPPSYNAFLFVLAAGIVALGIYLAMSWYL